MVAMSTRPSFLAEKGSIDVALLLFVVSKDLTHLVFEGMMRVRSSGDYKIL